MTTALHARLQQALGAAYTLEHELGGGGMSRVFVATELALGRRVVVKVLPDELVGQVSLERFRREIALAARLQHPHIVPLLTAGDAGGLPYFTMPLVEGESLRARLARQGELPLSEAMRLLREIASALSYAHERGIVHRDIKPDNVLLSGGSAMITDFGVAKAISASSNSDGANNTSLGVALGTPAYMSPEQASADPNVDHRADIYAFGVMAYELLTGQPPFSGRTPQGLLAAHVTESPEHVTRRRQTIPPALGALVMRCLEKRAADRPQTAMDLVHSLDQITTPSGGTAPTTAVNEVSASIPATTSTHSSARRWIGIAVAVAVVVAGAVWFGMSRSGVGAGGSRILAVLPTDLGSDTAHAYLADGLSSELTTRLSRIPGLAVRAYASSKTMRGKSLREAGNALQVTSLLTQSLMRSGNRLRVTASLVDVKNDRVEWSETFEESDQDQFALQDKLVNAIAGALKLSLSPATQAKVLSRGTRNAQALDLVQRANFLVDQFTEPSLRQAVSLAELAILKDSAYADAWAALVNAWGSLADDFIAPHEAIPEILRARARAVALDPSSAEVRAQAGINRFWQDWDLDGAIRELEIALTLDSANTSAAFLLPDALLLKGGLADSAIRVQERAIRLNPGHEAMLTAASKTQRMIHMPDALRREHCAALKRLNEQGAMTCELNRLFVEGDTVASRALMRTMFSDQSLNGSAQARRAKTRAQLGDTQGARADLASAIAKSSKEYVREDAIAYTYFVLGDVEQSIQWWKRSVASHGSQVIYLAKDPLFASLRRDPRIQAMLRDAGVRPATIKA